MRIILTESQLEKLRVITENSEYVHKMKDSIKNLKVDVNKLYSVISFTTIAEFRDGDTDIYDVEKKYEIMANKMFNLDSQLLQFQERHTDSDSDWANPELEKSYDEMNIALNGLEPKINSLYNIIDGIKTAVELEYHTPFKDIKPINV